MSIGERLSVLYGLVLAPVVMFAGILNHYLGAIMIMNEDFTRGLFVLASMGLIIGSSAQVVQAILSEKKLSLLMLLVFLLNLSTSGLVYWYFIYWKNL
ncbi:MAG: hypothetical protein KDI30_11990 [Pseudomonadales bacterium]|nr:hypothetical protein [Pseudomonadales bacterium]